MNNALIIASNEELIDAGLSNYLQSNIIVPLAGYGSGSEWCFVMTNDNSRRCPIKKELLIAEGTIMKIKDDPKSKLIPRNLYSQVVNVDKILDAESVRVDLPGNKHLNVSPDDLCHV